MLRSSAWQYTRDIAAQPSSGTPSLSSWGTKDLILLVESSCRKKRLFPSYTKIYYKAREDASCLSMTVHPRYCRSAILRNCVSVILRNEGSNPTVWKQLQLGAESIALSSWGTKDLIQLVESSCRKKRQFPSYTKIYYKAREDASLLSMAVHMRNGLSSILRNCVSVILRNEGSNPAGWKQLQKKRLFPS